MRALRASKLAILPICAEPSGLLAPSMGLAPSGPAFGGPNLFPTDLSKSRRVRDANNKAPPLSGALLFALASPMRLVTDVKCFRLPLRDVLAA